MVHTVLKNSPLHGIGLFADQFIQTGTVTWEYNPKFDTSFSEEDIKEMSEPARKQFLHYAYLDHEQKKYILCFDDQRFINHSSDNSNIASTPNKDVAARDIQKGEELICNYQHFESTYFERRQIDDKTFK